MVKAMIAMTVISNVLVVSCLVRRNIRIITTSGKCRWNAITGKLATTQASVIRKVACHRPGYGLSSSRRNSKNRFACAETAGKVAVPVISPLVGGGHFRGGPAQNGYDRGCTDPESVVRVVHKDSHREALRQPNPIKISWHIWQADGA